MLEFNKNIIIVGYSGHAYVVIDTLIDLGTKILGYTEKKELSANPFDLNYLGYENDLKFPFFGKKYNYIIGIGDNKIRSSISKFLRSKKCNMINVVHPSSSVSINSSLGSGIFIGKNVSISPLCKFGNDIIINNSATIDHECIINSGSHIAPGAVLLGNVKVGKNSFIGASSVVKEGVSIGDNVVVGAGSVVLKNIDSNSLVYGNPAK